MATAEQIKRFLTEFQTVQPTELWTRVNQSQVGIGAVLRMLYEAEEPVTAGNISDTLQVSTARVAVLLKKTVSKGLIVKETAPKDARITIVRLTEHGSEVVRQMKAELREQIGILIDQIGEERLHDFLEIAVEIRKTIQPPHVDF